MRLERADDLHRNNLVEVPAYSICRQMLEKIKLAVRQRNQSIALLESLERGNDLGKGRQQLPQGHQLVNTC